MQWIFFTSWWSRCMHSMPFHVRDSLPPPPTNLCSQALHNTTINLAGSCFLHRKQSRCRLLYRQRITVLPGIAQFSLCRMIIVSLCRMIIGCRGSVSLLWIHCPASRPLVWYGTYPLSQPAPQGFDRSCWDPTRCGQHADIRYQPHSSKAVWIQSIMLHDPGVCDGSYAFVAKTRNPWEYTGTHLRSECTVLQVPAKQQ